MVQTALSYLHIGETENKKTRTWNYIENAERDIFQTSQNKEEV